MPGRAVGFPRSIPQPGTRLGTPQELREVRELLVGREAEVASLQASLAAAEAARLSDVREVRRTTSESVSSSVD